MSKTSDWENYGNETALGRYQDQVDRDDELQYTIEERAGKIKTVNELYDALPSDTRDVIFDLLRLAAERLLRIEAEAANEPD